MRCFGRPPTRNTAANKRLAVYFGLFWFLSQQDHWVKLPVPTGLMQYFISNNQESPEAWPAALAGFLRLLDLEVERQRGIPLCTTSRKITQGVPHRFCLFFKKTIATCSIWMTRSGLIVMRQPMA